MAYIPAPSPGEELGRRGLHRAAAWLLWRLGKGPGCPRAPRTPPSLGFPPTSHLNVLPSREETSQVALPVGPHTRDLIIA